MLFDPAVDNRISTANHYVGSALGENSNVSNAEEISTRASANGQESRERVHQRRDFLNSIVEQYYTRLVRFLRNRRLSAEDADDMAQETFARLSAADPADIRAPGPFLFTVAHNLVRDHARSAAKRASNEPLSQHDDKLVSFTPAADDLCSGREQVAVLEAALAELSPKCRAVLVMYRFDEMSHKEIAESLGISVSMVEKYVQQALRHCRKRMNEANENNNLPRYLDVTTR